MTADMISNTKLKIKHFTCFVPQSYFEIPKNVRLNSTHYLYFENCKQKRASTNSNNSFIRYRFDKQFFKSALQKSILFLVNDTTLSSDNPLRFRKSLLEGIYDKINTTDDQIKD